jgi:hypothetical protein
MHALPAHVGEVHWRAGWAFELGHGPDDSRTEQRELSTGDFGVGDCNRTHCQVD